MLDEVVVAAAKLGALVAAGAGLTLAQAATSDPVSTWIDLGGQAAAWSIVLYFARSLLTGQMVVRSQADDRAKWEAAQQRWEEIAKEMREALVDSHAREGQLHDLIAELRRTPRTARS